MEKNNLTLSSLQHTWLIDLDGTLVKHNGYLINGQDTLLPSSIEFLRNIPKGDTLIFLTSREKKYRQVTENFLNDKGIKYDHIIFGLPMGERILINDSKESGLPMAYAIQLDRNKGISTDITIDDSL